MKCQVVHWLATTCVLQLETSPRDVTTVKYNKQLIAASLASETSQAAQRHNISVLCVDSTAAPRFPRIFSVL